MFQSHAIGEIGGVAGVGDEDLAFLDEEVHQVVWNGPVGMGIGTFCKQYAKLFFEIIGVHSIGNRNCKMGVVPIVAS